MNEFTEEKGFNASNQFLYSIEKAIKERAAIDDALFKTTSILPAQFKYFLDNTQRDHIGMARAEVAEGMSGVA